MQFKHLCAALALSAALVLGASPGFGQVTRTWVSGVGDDVNPCSRTAPCKTFAGAISKTAAGGEINCLDPGGFGSLTITKAISIVCSAGEGGVLVSGTNGINISAGPSDAIVLSGIDVEGANGGVIGVSFTSGGSLTLINSNIRDFLTGGIQFAPTGNAALNVVNSRINNSVQLGSSAGIYIIPVGSATATVSILQTQITNGLTGIVADGSRTSGAINGVVQDSTVSNNSQAGIITMNGTAAHSTLVVDHTSVLGNGGNGLTATGSLAGMLVTNSTIFGNQAGLVTQSGGVLVSYGNNRVNGNHGADGSFSSTVGTK